MRRSNSRSTSDRDSNGLTRTTLDKADDSTLLQILSIKGFSNEAQKTIEHAHPYGFSMFPKGPSQATSGSGGSTAGQGGDGAKAAEAFIAFVGGSRSHGVTLMVSDRRFRMMKMQEGEVANHDDQTQQRHLARTGIVDSTINTLMHQQRIMKSGDKVNNNAFGQTPWLSKTPYSYHHHDKNVQQSQHPTTINHHIISGDAHLPGDTTSSNVIHKTTLDQTAGILHSAFSGNHKVAITSSGIDQTTTGSLTRTAATTITDTATTLAHDGNTSVTGFLGVTSYVNASAFNIVSDRTHKTDYRPARYGLESLLKVGINEFVRTDIDDPAIGRSMGPTAQDLYDVCPDAVIPGNDDVPWRVKQDFLIGWAIKAIQDQHAEIVELRRMVSALAAKVSGA